MWIIVAIVGGLVVLGLIIAWSVSSGSANKRDVSLWATERGLTYTRGTSRLLDYLRGSPYDVGSGTAITHVATGDLGGSRVLVMVFDTHLGDAHVPVVTVAVSLPRAVPELSVRRQTAADVTRGRDLQLESGEFNATFRLACAEPKFAYDVLSPTMMQFLLTDPRARTYRIRYDGPMLVVWRDGELTDVTELERMLDFAHELVSRTARFVFDSGWTLGPKQTHVALRDIPAEAFGDVGTGAVHQRRTVQHRGHTVEQADHIMDSRGIRDWFTVVSIDYPTPWPAITISSKEFILAASTHTMIPRYDDEVLTGDAEFDRIFAVGSARPDFVHAVLTPELTRWLVADPRLRRAELIFVPVIRRPGRDGVSEIRNLGRVEVSGLGRLADAEPAGWLTELLCDVVDRLSPGVFQAGQATTP